MEDYWILPGIAYRLLNKGKTKFSMRLLIWTPFYLINKDYFRSSAYTAESLISDIFTLITHCKQFS